MNKIIGVFIIIFFSLGIQAQEIKLSMDESIAVTLGDVYKNPMQQDIVSVGFTIPLVDWGQRKGKVNMARNNLNVAKISIRQRELSLEQDVVMTANDFNIRQNLIVSAEEALQLATMAYNATRQRFIIGKADLNSLTVWNA